MVAVGVIGLLVAPVGVAWWAPVLVGAVIGVVLMADVRNDLASLPPLVGSGTELRRQFDVVAAGGAGACRRSWWCVVVGAVVPTSPTPFDLRRFVHPDTIRVEDPNPLAVAARWRELDSPEPTARVEVDGASPGRLRLAVLDGYTDTGWQQAADYEVTGDRFAADPLYPASRGRPDHRGDRRAGRARPGSGPCRRRVSRIAPTIPPASASPRWPARSTPATGPVG